MPLTTVESWSLSSPRQFCHEEHYSNIRETKDFGARLEVPIGGVAFKIWGGLRSFFLYQSLPGLIPLYFFKQGDTICFSQSMLAIRAEASARGAMVKDIQQAKEGVAYHFSQKGLKRYVVDKFSTTYESPTLKEGGTKLLKALVSAADFLKGKRVLTLISGGTDGILTALALKIAGVEQICVCIGRDEEDFDPRYAKLYAEQLELDYRFLPLPTSDADLQDLLHRTLQTIEMSDFSNVLMGMCNVMAAEKAIEWGCDYVANADLADVVLGNDIFTYGSFNKDNPKPTSAAWSKVRMEGQLKTLPTNLQIYKAFNFNGVPVVQLFADRPVLEFLLGLPLTLTPANGKKPLYYEILDRYLKGGSWGDTGKKVGYYTGSGIGKIRLENPVLSDANMRKTLSLIQDTK